MLAIMGPLVPGNHLAATDNDDLDPETGEVSS
jgi:hypothetical protein